MAGRGASAAVQAEWAAQANAPAHLCEVRLDAGDGGSVFLTDSYRVVSYGGNTYVAGGHLLSFQNLAESAELRVREVQVQLSGIDQSWVSIVLLKQYYKRPLLIYQMFWDRTTEQLVVNPVLVHNGVMEEPLIAEDPLAGKCTVTLTSRDQFGDFERPAGRHTNSFDQKLWFPNDASFDLFAQLAASNRQFIWGAPSGASSGIVTVGLGGVRSGALATAQKAPGG